MRQLTLLVFLVSAIANSALPAFAQNSAAELEIEARIPRKGDFLGFGYDAVWMMQQNNLVRVDPKDNSVVDIVIPNAYGRFRGIGIGEGGVWVRDTNEGSVIKVDPLSNEVVFAIPVVMYGAEGSVGIGEGSVWVTTEVAGKGMLVRFAASDGGEQASIDMPLGDAVTVAFGSAWVTDMIKSRVFRVDAATNTVTATIKSAAGPVFMTAAFDSLWVVCLGDGVVQRIDPATDQVVATIATGGHQGGDIISGGGYVWATYPDLPLVQIDPRTNKARTFAGSGFGDALAFGANSVWISGLEIRRVRPPAWP